MSVGEGLGFGEGFGRGDAFGVGEDVGEASGVAEPSGVGEASDVTEASGIGGVSGEGGEVSEGEESGLPSGDIDSDGAGDIEGIGLSGVSSIDGVGDDWASKFQIGRQSARPNRNEFNFNKGKDPIFRGVTLADGLRVAKNFRMSDYIFVGY